MMNWQAKWIRPSWENEGEAPLFSKAFCVKKALASAVLRMTGMGTYEAAINGARVSEDVLAPGWTSYAKRLQVQTYAQAMSRIYQKPVKEACLYFFRLNRFVVV